MRYQELTESRAGPLYHATTVKAALAIIAGDEIKANTVQLLDARRGKRYKMHDKEWQGAVYGFKMKGGRRAEGVSLTRDYNFAIRWQRSEVIFVLDQQQLTHHHTIVPTDHTNNGAYDYRAIGFEHMEQAEEFVIGDIAPLMPSLISINVTLDVLDHVTLEQFIDQRLLWAHPLLNRWYPRNLRNQYDRGHYEADHDTAIYLHKMYRMMRKEGKTPAEIIAHMRDLAERNVFAD